MVDDPSRIASERAPYHSPRSEPVQSTMSSWELAAHCLMEIEHYRLGEPYTDRVWVRIAQPSNNSGRSGGPGLDATLLRRNGARLAVLSSL